MAQEEKYGSRDLTYSVWHRRLSTRRFVGIERAQTLAMIDADVGVWVEYDDDDKMPLALVETARDVGQTYKPATVTANLARMAKIPAYVVLYTQSNTKNPAGSEWPDIEKFRVKRLTPDPEANWRILTPHQWAEALVSIRAFSAKKLDENDAHLSWLIGA